MKPVITTRQEETETVNVWVEQGKCAAQYMMRQLEVEGERSTVPHAPPRLHIQPDHSLSH